MKKLTEWILDEFDKPTSFQMSLQADDGIYQHATENLTGNILSDEIDNATYVKEIQALTLLSDAEQYRSIYHKLDLQALRFYNICHSRWFVVLYRVVLFTFFVLPLFEWPSSLTMSSDVRLNLTRPILPCGVTESVEFLCLTVIILEVVFSTIAVSGFGLSRQPWHIGKCLCILVYTVDLLVSLSLHCSEFYRIRRFLRPYFFIANSQLMKKLLNCIRRTTPKLLSTLLLLFLWIVGASLLAMCFFQPLKANSPVPKIKSQFGLTSAPTALAGGEDEEEETHTDPSYSFPDMYTSVFNLLVLVTTANHPDVLMLYYNKNRATVLFTIVFLGLGLYVVMNILTAIVYSEFRGYFLSSVRSRLIRRRVAIRAVFETLKAVDSTDRENAVVASKTLIRLIDLSRLPSWKKITLRSTYLERFAEGDLTVAEFMDLFRTVDLVGPLLGQTVESYPTRTGCAELCRTWIMSSQFTYLGIAVAFLNIVSMTINMSTHMDLQEAISTEMRVINWCFVIFYAMEQCCFIWAFGIHNYFRNWTCIVSFTAVLLLVILKLVELVFLLEEARGLHLSIFNFALWDIIRLINIILVTRAVRVVDVFRWTRLVAVTVTALPRILAPVLGVLLSAYYFYALLGMSLFQGAIKYNEFNNLSGAASTCGTYQQLNYWSVNFDDFGASVVVLWDLMVVNNWFVIVNAFSEVVGMWVHVYMISWWIIAVVGLLSLVTALIIETFVHHRDLSEKEYRQMRQTFRLVSMNNIQVLVPTCTTTTTTTSAPTVPSGPNSTQNSDRANHDRNKEEPVVYPCNDNFNSFMNSCPRSSPDELFINSECEPTEEEIIAAIEQHPYFKGTCRTSNTNVGPSTSEQRENIVCFRL